MIPKTILITEEQKELLNYLIFNLGVSATKSGKKGMFEGDLVEGELEIGQISSVIDKILPIKDIMEEIITEFQSQKEKISSLEF